VQASNLSIDDAALLGRLAAGDQRAFDPLYARHQARLYRYAWRMSGSPEVAEDIVQEVFLALIRGARAFDPARGSLGGYLFGTARHLLCRHWGLDGAEEDLDENTATPESDPLEGLAQAERVERLRAALATLPAAYREAIVLCEMEELDYAEVAMLLDIPVGTVRSRLHRGRALLARRLNGERCRI
jgi:RNA polymerase sigma-70 factor (ECF subfamily)